MESNAILHYQGQLYVPEQMIPTILESEHDSKQGGHFGQEITNELLRRNFS